ncbi:MAG: efflux RND transporter periplasmic adaptor subunit [Flavobacteriaceae bacterium]|nr:efflux RND transporter periplasmic adaptor subunit [Flavobacteriaceae bacterium]
MKFITYKIVILSAMFMLMSCGEDKKPSTAVGVETLDDRILVTQAQFDQNKMVLGGIEEKMFTSVVSVNGMIDVPPENKAVISATLGGYIKQTHLLIGDKIEKGQKLITIENPEFVTLQQDYMEVGEQLNYLKSEFDRQKIMRAENITSERSFLKAESQYKSALANHNGMRKKLEMLNISISNVSQGNISSVATIYAPISGSITKVNVSIGAYVSPATPILEIINNDHIHLELSIFEKDIMKIKKDQNIEFTIPEASSEVFNAKVYLVGTAINADRTIKVHAHLDEESDKNFLTGMFVNANIITDAEMRFAVPDETISASDDIQYVLVLDEAREGDYYFKQIEVQVISNQKGYSIIESQNTFNATDQFLTKGAFRLINE